MREEIPERVLRLLEKLQKITEDNNCTENEIQTAAATVKKLCLEYDLSLLDLPSNQYEDIKATTATCNSYYKELAPHYRYLASSMAKAFDCRIVYQFNMWQEKERRKGTVITFIGMPSDCQVAVFFYRILWNAFDRMCKRDAKKARIPKDEMNAYRQSYYTSAADAVYNRLKQEADKGGSKGTEIVLAKDIKVKELMDKLFPSTRLIHNTSKYHDQGAIDGSRAGQTVELTKGVDEKTPQSKKIDPNRKGLPHE
jgi:hypothetical protein